tara:strand:+ start:200 stop:1228 length:1029 start_codon:yes stop_codon:yes gene_type:complete
MKKKVNSYKNSGVNISLGNKFVEHISKLTGKSVKKEKKNSTSNNIGGFASVFDLTKINITDPVLVSCTDGVGTKLDLADKFKKLDTIGIDLVAMCVNDLIVQGARPLFFLDYIAIDKLRMGKVKKIFSGILKGCKIAKCNLSGGETAEMPGIYMKNKFDLAGFAVGIASKRKLLHKNKVKNRDLIIAVPSNGLHSNGFSLVRKIINKKSLSKKLKDDILKPTRIYTNEVLKLTKKNLINAGANITGGGLIENIIRSVPKKFQVNVDLSKIKVLKIFKWLKSHNISDKEMLKTFNCGVGFCLIINENNLAKIKKIFPKKYIPYVIGYISKGKKRLNLINQIKW